MFYELIYQKEKITNEFCVEFEKDTCMSAMLTRLIETVRVLDNCELSIYIINLKLSNEVYFY